MTREQDSPVVTSGFWRPVDLEAAPIDSDTLEIIGLERHSPIKITKDHSLRAKILDACGMTCQFCHNEGTPVAGTVDPENVSLGGLKRSARVSVFVDTNGVNFSPGVMEANDAQFGLSLAALRDLVGVNELHFSGGEPSLHPRLPELVLAASELGYDVKMTSNGELGYRVIPECAKAGLSKINFSIFGTTPEELAMVQHQRFQNTYLAQKKLDSLKRSIAAASENGIGMSANIVMSDYSHAERVVRLIEEYDPQLEVRILPDLDRGDDSMLAIYKLLAELGARPVVTEVEAGSSNARVAYRLPDDRQIYFKQTRPTRLQVCEDCVFNNPTDCKEGYYGLRLYTDHYGKYLVGVCIQRMDLTVPLQEFIDSGLADQVVKFRDEEYDQLLAAINERQ